MAAAVIVLLLMNNQRGSGDGGGGHEPGPPWDWRDTVWLISIIVGIALIFGGVLWLAQS